jgi:hypothetical protein
LSKQVHLPPGCSGFTCADGTNISASRPGGTVTVSDRHADAINNSQYGDTGFISARGAVSFGTKKSRFCERCRNIWNAWNDVCPRCSTAEEPVPTVERNGDRHLVETA